MNTGILKQSFNRISSFIVRNQSTIFTATGIGCVISIPFVTVKPTIKALELIDEAADVKLDEEGRISEERINQSLERILKIKFAG